jgi:tRNA modification GTPase
MLDQDTICGVSTPPGEGGIGIIRISGARAIEIASRVFRPRSAKRLEDLSSHALLYGKVCAPGTGDIIDEALVSIMRAPASYTREDIVEINCHGGMMPLWRTVTLLIASGARQAEPGEFTKRAFLNGRIDLAQAEAVMDIIHAKTELSHRAANEQLLGGLSSEVATLRERLVSIVAAVEAGIDFPEEEIETPAGHPLADEIRSVLQSVEELISSHRYGRVLREGIATAIIGKPNVGKSSLLNSLLKQDRAIVTDIAGTTRDVLEEYLNIEGLPFKILDTAGIRHSHDVVEQESVKRSLAVIGQADVVLIILDGSQPLSKEDQRVLEEAKGKTAIIVMNKSDLGRKAEAPAWPEGVVEISCKTGAGLDSLRKSLVGLVQQGVVPPREHSWAVNQRHKTALEQAKASLEKALASTTSGLSPEFIALDLRDALDSVGLIIGATHTDDILERIFRDFCIGK